MIYNELQENQKSAAAGALHLFFENFRFRETKFSEKHGFFGRFFGQKSGRWRPEKPFNDGGMTKSGGKWRKFFKEKKPPEIQPRFLRKNAPKPQRMALYTPAANLKVKLEGERAETVFGVRRGNQRPCSRGPGALTRRCGPPGASRGCVFTDNGRRRQAGRGMEGPDGLIRASSRRLLRILSRGRERGRHRMASLCVNGQGLRRRRKSNRPRRAVGRCRSRWRHPAVSERPHALTAFTAAGRGKSARGNWSRPDRRNKTGCHWRCW